MPGRQQTQGIYSFFIGSSLSCRQVNRNDVQVFSLLSRALPRPEAFVMAIQDYVESIAATQKVSKDQVFRFLEMQFARADKNHDGQLDSDELAAFAQAISCPESDQR
jgi:hypothetical protein